MLTDYVIDDSMVGRALPITDGFLVSLRLTTPPPVYETPEGDDGSGVWRSGYLQLRGSGDHKDLFCASPSSWGYVSKLLVGNQSLPYRGDLRVLCVPRGSEFSVTLSDIPIDRTLLAAPGDLDEYRASLLATIMREQREREMITR
jgi:hypothetical protein